MTLLDKANEDVTVYVEETVIDADGNSIKRPSETGIPAKATIQPAPRQTGSTDEQNNGGYVSEEIYRLRFPRSFPHILGSAARIEWRGESWGIMGEPRFYNGSPRTRRVEYRIRRA